jgi:L-asparaginase II
VNPIKVTVRRGAVVESTHLVHAVAVRDGAVVEAAGDSGRIAFLRSSAKPFQALPLVRARPDLTTEEIGMLALCRAKGWASGGYRLETHPVQHACLAEVAAAADVPADEIPTAVDGCGVVTFALSLERMALMFTRLEQLEGGAEVTGAMRTHPDLIRGPMAADTLLMREREGWTAKGGAEGLLCAAGPDGLGVALKVDDGTMRAMRPALAELLRRLGFETGELGEEPLLNSRGELVGEVVSDR